MQDVAPVIALVGILVFLAHLFTGIFRRTRVPDVLWLVVIGICLGPALESGLALKLRTLRSALGGAITLAPLCFFLTMAVVAGLALWLTDLEVIPAFILGAIVGSTSETVVIPLIRQLKMKEETQTLLSVESSVNDVLSIAVTVALVEAYMLGEFQFAPVAGDLIASFIVAIVFGVIGAFIWSILLNRIHAIKNAMFTTPAFVFVIFGIVEILGFSGAIAALAFGVTIGNVESIRLPIFKNPLASEPTSLTETERVFFSEVAFLLKTFFFVYLGISLEFISPWLIILGLILTIVVFVLRVPVVKFSTSGEIPVKDASIIAIMVPKGLAAVVLASIPLQQEIIGGELIKNVTYGVVLFSIVLTSLLILLLDKTNLADFYRWVLSPGQPKMPFKPKPSPDLEKPRILSPKLKAKTDQIKPIGNKLFSRSKK
jgi:cell volume regulation protein A